MRTPTFAKNAEINFEAIGSTDDGGFLKSYVISCMELIPNYELPQVR